MTYVTISDNDVMDKRGEHHRIPINTDVNSMIRLQRAEGQHSLVVSVINNV
jgi:hypothetical protein